MAITGAITGVMIAVSGTFILTSVGDDMYTDRREQVLDDSARATLAVQRMLDASEANDRRSLSLLIGNVRSIVQTTSSSQLIYVRRVPGQEAFPEAPIDFNTAPQLMRAVSMELSQQAAVGEDPQYWQPATLLDPETLTENPAIIVATRITFPSGAGTYNIFIGYSLAETERTLEFITRTLALTALILMLLIGALVWTISNIVFRPIRAAADASRRLAAGEDDARMSLQNDEHFDVLSENFNTMADTLQARIDDLDDLSIMQQRFVSDVSHELRTPLTTIRLASEVLNGQQETLSAPQQRAIEVLSAQVERFELLLTDLLEISRYDAGRVTLGLEPTNIVQLVSEVVEGLQPLAPAIIEVRPLGGYRPLEVDPRRIRRIISNLVGNAIEHGEDQPVVVTIDSNESAVAVGVRDWGVGMNAEDTTHVFDRFWRADPSRKRTLGGTGLGLAIAQEDAAAHGGIIEVWSKPGGGTHFRVTLPRDASERSFISPIALVPEDASATGGDAGVTGGLPRNWRRRLLRDNRKRGEA